MSISEDVQGEPGVQRRKRTPWRRAVTVTVGLVAGLVCGTTHAAAQPAPTDRIMMRLDVGWRPASRTFAGNRVLTTFSEQGGFQADYDTQGGGVVDGDISLLLWRNVGVGLGVSYYRSINPARIIFEVPHPFFFDLPRLTTGVADGLERQELGIHVRALWAMQLTDWLVVSVSAGPSLINAGQDLVASVEYTEVGFPFDEIIFAGHTVTGQSENDFGFNGGVDVDAFVLDRLPFLNRYDVMEHVGLGLLVRYLRGSVNLQVGDDRVEVDLGGLQVTTGLRFRF